MKSFPGRKNLNSTVILALKISSDKVFLFLMCKSTFCHLMACPFTLYFLPFHTFFLYYSVQCSHTNAGFFDVSGLLSG